jgi:hypothetical protein
MAFHDPAEVPHRGYLGYFRYASSGYGPGVVLSTERRRLDAIANNIHEPAEKEFDHVA